MYFPILPNSYLMLFYLSLIEIIEMNFVQFFLMQTNLNRMQMRKQHIICWSMLVEVWLQEIDIKITGKWVIDGIDSTNYSCIVKLCPSHFN